MNTSMDEPRPLPEELNQETRDLGFGSVLSQEKNLRLLNRDGTFNVFRKRKSTLASLFTYHGLLSMPAPLFVAIVAVIYVVLNVVFAIGYLLCGPTALQGLPVQHHFRGKLAGRLRAGEYRARRGGSGACSYRGSET